MKLYCINEFLGDISSVTVDGMWITGMITAAEAMEKFKKFFAALVDEENDFNKANYPKQWLEDHNWFMVDKDNKKKGIYIPAVYPDGEICWKWRSLID